MGGEEKAFHIKDHLYLDCRVDRLPRLSLLTTPAPRQPLFLFPQVLAGSRLYPPEVREALISDDERLLCAAKRTLLDTAVVGITEHYNVSVCLLFHTMGWDSLFSSCCGRGLAQGLQCHALTDKLTANVRDVRSETKVASSASNDYANRSVVGVL